jgi:hypothetical protein
LRLREILPEYSPLGEERDLSFPLVSSGLKPSVNFSPAE